MLSGMGLKQHVVEFTTSGVITDGVLAAGSGPFSWLVPAGVCELGMNATGAGGGGCAGLGGTGTVKNGGAAGGTGLMIHGALLPVLPNTVLTITLGSGGVSGALGANGTPGGVSTIAGLNALMGTNDGIAGKIQISGGWGGYAAGASYAGSSGGIYYSGGGVNATPTASPGTGPVGDSISQLRYSGIFGGSMFAFYGGGGGAASTTGSTAGGNGGGASRVSGNMLMNILMGGSGATPGYGGAGTTDGTNSYGGGGCGPASFYGYPGAAGTGSTAALSGAGWGYGGSGGGGNSLGAAGGDAYIRIVYWSTD